jgi:formylglycine-generating enzyme required for sulfatase activity
LYVTHGEEQNAAWGWKDGKVDKYPGLSWRSPGFPQRDDHPVVCLNWYDAVAFCDWLSREEERWYRLPSDGQWEYAARAGVKTTYLWGDDPNQGEGWCNCADEASKNEPSLRRQGFPWSDKYAYTSPVRSFKPNAWGFYDVIGNAQEWTADWFGDLPPETQTDPTGAAKPGPTPYRVVRGGSFSYGVKDSRTANRSAYHWQTAVCSMGLRVLLKE